MGIRVSILIDVRIDILDHGTNEWKPSKVSETVREVHIFGRRPSLEKRMRLKLPLLRYRIKKLKEEQGKFGLVHDSI